MSAFSLHSVFVLDPSGKPLTPTTPAKARKLLRGGVARKVRSKLGTFGVQLLVSTRRETPRVALGVDHGTKFEGYPAGQEEDPQEVGRAPGDAPGTSVPQVPSPAMSVGQPEPPRLPGPKPEGPRGLPAEGPR